MPAVKVNLKDFVIKQTYTGNHAGYASSAYLVLQQFRGDALQKTMVARLGYPNDKKWSITDNWSGDPVEVDANELEVKENDYFLVALHVFQGSNKLDQLIKAFFANVGNAAIGKLSTLVGSSLDGFFAAQKAKLPTGDIGDWLGKIVDEMQGKARKTVSSIFSEMLENLKKGGDSSITTAAGIMKIPAVIGGDYSVALFCTGAEILNPDIDHDGIEKIPSGPVGQFAGYGLIELKS